MKTLILFILTLASVQVTIAEKCPLIDGPAVYAARALTAQGRDMDYTIACDPKPGARIAGGGDDETAEENSHSELVSESVELNSIKLYPNPNNGQMHLEYNLAEGKEGSVIITDVTGKTINSYSILGRNTLKVSEAELKNGIYFYRVLVNGEVLHQDKIVIIK